MKFLIENHRHANLVKYIKKYNLSRDNRRVLNVKF